MKNPDPTLRSRSPTRTAALLIASIAVVGALGVFVWDHRADLEQAFQASPTDLATLFVLVIVGQAMNSYEFYLLFRASGVQISSIENWSVFNAGQLGNYAPLQLGTIYRFRYLKVVHGLRYAANASTMAMNLVITIASTALCGITGVIWYAAAGEGRLSWILLALFSALLLFGLLAALLPMPRILRPHAGHRGRIGAAWREFHRGWESTRSRPSVGLTVLAIDVTKLVLLSIRFQLAFSLLGIDAPFPLALVLGPVAALVAFVSFTPGALGLREAAVAGAAAALGYTIPTGLLAATIDRGVMLVATIILGSIGYAATVPRLRRATASAAADS